jgi:hypothetical protein
LGFHQVLYDVATSGVFFIVVINFTEFGVEVIIFRQILIVAFGLTSIKFMNGRKKLCQQIRLRSHIESSLCFVPPLQFAAARQRQVMTSLPTKSGAESA